MHGHLEVDTTNEATRALLTNRIAVSWSHFQAMQLIHCMANGPFSHMSWCYYMALQTQACTSDPGFRKSFPTPSMAITFHHVAALLPSCPVHTDTQGSHFCPNILLYSLLRCWAIVVTAQSIPRQRTTWKKCGGVLEGNGNCGSRWEGFFWTQQSPVWRRLPHHNTWEMDDSLASSEKPWVSARPESTLKYVS